MHQRGVQTISIAHAFHSMARSFQCTKEEFKLSDFFFDFYVLNLFQCTKEEFKPRIRFLSSSAVMSFNAPKRSSNLSPDFLILLLFNVSMHQRGVQTYFSISIISFFPQFQCTKEEFKLISVGRYPLLYDLFQCTKEEFKRIRNCFLSQLPSLVSMHQRGVQTSIVSSN